MFSNIPPSRSRIHVTGRNSHGQSILSVLKLVDLAMAHIVVPIRESGLGVASLGHVSPALFIVLAAVEGQGGGEDDLERLAHAAGVELCVDVQAHVDGLVDVGGFAIETRDSVVLLGVDILDPELLLEEVGIACESRHGCWCECGSSLLGLLEIVEGRECFVGSCIRCSGDSWDS